MLKYRFQCVFDVKIHIVCIMQLLYTAKQNFTKLINKIVHILNLFSTGQTHKHTYTYHVPGVSTIIKSEIAVFTRIFN